MGPAKNHAEHTRVRALVAREPSSTFLSSSRSSHFPTLSTFPTALSLPVSRPSLSLLATLFPSRVGSRPRGSSGPRQRTHNLLAGRRAGRQCKGGTYRVECVGLGNADRCRATPATTPVGPVHDFVAVGQREGGPSTRRRNRKAEFSLFGHGKRRQYSRGGGLPGAGAVRQRQLWVKATSTAEPRRRNEATPERERGREQSKFGLFWERGRS